MPTLRAFLLVLTLLVPAAAVPLGAGLAPSGDAVPVPELYLPIWPEDLTEVAPAATYTLPDGRQHEVRSWGIETLKADEAWARGITGAGVRVAIIDTGIDLDHPYLAPNIAWTKNVCHPTRNVEDDNSHGTHVAGIVKQTAPDVTLYIIKVLGATCTSTPLDTAFLVAGRGPDGVLGTNDDPHIITVSIGQGIGVGPTGPLHGVDGSLFHGTYTSVFTQLQNRGILLTISSGNDYANLGTNAPSSHPLALSVGSLTSGRSVAEYSSNGRTDGDDTRRGPSELDIAAPGSAVSSTVPIGTCSFCSTTGWGSKSGTSMAAPHAAGVLALMYQDAPWGRSSAAAESAKAALRCGSEDLYLSGKLSGPGYDLSTGYGLPQVDALLDGRCIFTHRNERIQLLADSAEGMIGPTVDAVDRAADALLGRFGTDAEDYDGDGTPDADDPLNAPGEGAVLTSGGDRLTASLRAGGVALAYAPDGTLFGVASRTFTGTVTVRFDGTVTPAGADVVPILPAAPALADGTWTLQSDVKSGGTFQGDLALTVGGKTVTVPGSLVNGAASGSVHVWNWHKQTDPEFTYTGATNAYPSAEQSPRYLRVYSMAAGLLA